MVPGNCDNEKIMKIRHLLTTVKAAMRLQSRLAKYSLALLGVAILSVLTLEAATSPVMLNGIEVHPTRILAQYRNANQLAANAPSLQQVGLAVFRQYSLVPGMVVLEDLNPKDATTNSAAALQSRLLSRMETLRQSGQFEFVEPDYIVHGTATPTDQAFTNGVLWGLRNYGQNGGVAGADISATNAWDLTTGSTNVIVAVIDTGVRYTHRDLRNQMWRNPGEIPANGIDDDQNGFVDDVYGINAINGIGDPSDTEGHGTHVSGTIGAAANDGNPSVGVTWRVRIMGCKFLGDFGGTTSDAITCVNYAVSKGARILNNSWGGGGFSQALLNAINAARAKGVLFIAAAGNGATDNDQDPYYPANYAADNVISVAALDRFDRLATFSQYGAKTVHLGAPGVSIYSSTAGSDTEYQLYNGTSMAAPHVSGVAALILSLYPSADYTEVRQRILLGTVPIPALDRKTTTGGRLNAYKALTLSGTGQLLATVTPPSGSVLLTSSTQPVYVEVSDTFGVYNATVTASIAGLTNLVFTNNGRSPDVVSNDNVYSSVVLVPAVTNPLTMTVVATAPGKVAITNVVNYSVAPPPPNDYFTNATKVPTGGAVYLANNRFATLEPNEPRHNGSTNAAASLWWVWTPTSNTNVFIDLTGSRIDTVLAVYRGSALTNLTAVISTNSDLIQHRPAFVSFNATAGVGYRIAVGAASTNSLGSIQIRIAPGGHFDATPPAVFVNSPLSGLTVSSPFLNITGTAVDPVPNSSGVMEVFVALNGGIAASANGTTNWTAPVFLIPGQNLIEARALDEAGNFSSPLTIQVNYVVPPATNDLFVNALSLTALPEVSSATTTNATKEFGEPAHAGNNGGHSVWWWFRPPADGVLTLSTTNSTFDTLLGLYTGPNVRELTEVASNDDAYPEARRGFSALTQAVRSNQTYYVAVDGFDGVSGDVSLAYNFTPANVFRLTFSTGGGGRVTPDSGDVVSNSTVVLTGMADPYFEFDSWSGSITSTANPLSLVVTSDTTLTAHFRPISFTQDYEDGSLLKLGWSSSGDLPWLVQTDTVLAGSFSARSGAIGDNQSSSLVLTTNFSGGAASFYFKVSSELGWDFLSFHLDGELVQKWSGEIDWTSFLFPMPVGTHTLEWRYSKDSGLSDGLDAAFLDNLNLPLGLPIDASTPAYLQIHRQTDGNLQLLILGQTNREYVIQGATDLTAPIRWQNLSTNTATGGFIEYVDPGAGTNSLRFYRAIVP